MSTLAIPRPGKLGDLEYIPGDSLLLKFEFHVAGAETPIDVSDSVITFTCLTESGDLDVTPTVDDSRAAFGDIRVDFTGTQTASFPRYFQVRVSETPRWNRTILVGHVHRCAFITGSFAVDPVIEDNPYISIPVAVVPTTAPAGATWDSIGAVVWDITTTWEEI